MRQDATQARPRRVLAAAVLGPARFIWLAIRVTVFACLSVLEPVVRFMLASLAILGVLTALFLEFVVQQPGFPFWFVLAGSAGCVVLLLLYYALMRLFSS